MAKLDVLLKLILFLPFPLNRSFISFIENYYYLKSRKQITSSIGNQPKQVQHNEPNKIKVLFYHVSGLSSGGTEKFLQIIAKFLNKDLFEVYFMYSPKPRDISGNIPLDGRKSYLENSSLKLIEFDYESLDTKYPYVVNDMNPSVFEILGKYQIDLFITAGAGYSEFPFIAIRKTPIILINIFGSISTQKNIFKNISISKEVDSKIKKIVSVNKREIMYIQSEFPNPEYKKLGKGLRFKFGIKDSDVVFGRIGRPDDSIFDAIGIEAFKKVVRAHPEAHYIIMSPPPILKIIVYNESIKNVHFIDPSSEEEDIWGFHYSLDALAHFRLDGESFGLNIAESMIAGNPILTHKSHIWNAHLEYLDSSFSFSNY